MYNINEVFEFLIFFIGATCVLFESAFNFFRKWLILHELLFNFIERNIFWSIRIIEAESSHAKHKCT